MVTDILTKRAVGYIRVSTAEQAGERHSSLETQESRVHAFCDSLGYPYVGLFTDVQSGRRDDRQEYRRMLDFVRSGGADAVVVQFLDRFGRNPREILTRIWELQERNVQVIATDEDIREELVLLVRAGLAGAESKRTSERVRAYMTRSAEKGVHVGRAPYGYRATRVNNTVTWEQEPGEAATIKEMYRLAVEENQGHKAIADVLTMRGYPTREGRPWASYTVQRVLTSEAIAGVLVYGKQPKKGNPARETVRLEGFFPAVLTKEEWQKLQERLGIRRESARGSTHKSDYLLSGIARCGYCGGPMVGKVGSLKQGSNARPGERYRNYWCSWALQSRAKCSHSNGHAAAKLETAVLDYLGQYSDPDRVRALLEADKGRASIRLEQELALLQKRLEAIERDFAENLALLKRNILDEADFLRANATRKQERTDLENRRAELTQQLAVVRQHEETTAAIPQRIRSFSADFGGMDTRKAKAVLQTILKAAHVYSVKTELEFRIGS